MFNITKYETFQSCANQALRALERPDKSDLPSVQKICEKANKILQKQATWFESIVLWIADLFCSLSTQMEQAANQALTFGRAARWIQTQELAVGEVPNDQLPQILAIRELFGRAKPSAQQAIVANHVLDAPLTPNASLVDLRYTVDDYLNRNAPAPAALRSPLLSNPRLSNSSLRSDHTLIRFRALLVNLLNAPRRDLLTANKEEFKAQLQDCLNNTKEKRNVKSGLVEQLHLDSNRMHPTILDNTATANLYNFRSSSTNASALKSKLEDPSQDYQTLFPMFKQALDAMTDNPSFKTALEIAVSQIPAVALNDHIVPRLATLLTLDDDLLKIKMLSRCSGLKFTSQEGIIWHDFEVAYFPYDNNPPELSEERLHVRGYVQFTLDKTGSFTILDVYADLAANPHPLPEGYNTIC